MRESGIHVVGWGHSRFGRLPDRSIEELIVEVSGEAIASAGLEPRDIDAVFVGNFNSGLLPLSFVSSLALQLSDDLAGTPATRVENACASGAAAVHQGFAALLSGLAERVLVVGAEKMTHASADAVSLALSGGDYDTAGNPGPGGFVGQFAKVAIAYEERYGPVTDALAMIAAKNHRNGVANPYAHIRKDLGVDFCKMTSESNPLIADPLRRTDCSPVSDGAAAVVLSAEHSAFARVPPVMVTGFGQANDFLPARKRDPLAFAGTHVAWQRSMRAASVELRDLSFIELHDCFTIAELNLYEVLGIAERGGAWRAIESGLVQRDGRLPVNVSGGLKSKGHPVGATGVSQHVMTAMQLSGTAGAMQLESPSRGAVHNMGGLAVANYVTVLEATI